MPDDFPRNHLVVKDGAEVLRDNTVARFKTATFFLGNHGPFQERLPAETWDQELNTRTEKLQQQLRNVKG